jgi:signal peptidase I
MDDRKGFVTLEDEILLSGNAMEGLMRDVLARGVKFRFRAKGFSMSPFILNGDLISVSPMSDAPPEVGEVVAFIEPDMGKLVVHRIVSIESDGYLTWGDNQVDHSDGVIPTENILGRVTLVERDGKIIRFGLGPEKSLIASLSRRHLLQPYLTRLAPLIRPLRRVLS